MAGALALRADARRPARALRTGRHPSRGRSRSPVERSRARHRSWLTVYLLDTNIVSMLDPRRRAPAPALIEWLERNGASLFLSVITITELDAGVLKLRRESKVKRADGLSGHGNIDPDGFRGSGVADRCRNSPPYRAAWRKQPFRQPVALADLTIAATAARHGLIVLTPNMGEFGPARRAGTQSVG